MLRARRVNGLLAKIMAAGVFLLATGALIVQGDAAAQPRAGETSKRYTLTIDPVTVTVGTRADAKVVIDVVKGWKFNLKYPSKIKFPETPDQVGVPKKMYKKDDFKVDGLKATVTVSLEAKKVGEAIVEGNLNFSVCDESKCLIERIKAEIKVKVVPPAHR